MTFVLANFFCYVLLQFSFLFCFVLLIFQSLPVRFPKNEIVPYSYEIPIGCWPCLDFMGWSNLLRYDQTIRILQMKFAFYAARTIQLLCFSFPIFLQFTIYSHLYLLFRCMLLCFKQSVLNDDLVSNYKSNFIYDISSLLSCK